MLGPFVTEFARNLGRETATPIQPGFNATSIGAAYAAGPVHTPPLQDAGGSHIITVGAFLTPLSPGVHTVTISGEFSGVGFQQTSGLAFVDFASTYTITVQPH